MIIYFSFKNLFFFLFRYRKIKNVNFESVTLIYINVSRYESAGVCFEFARFYRAKITAFISMIAFVQISFKLIYHFQLHI